MISGASVTPVSRDRSAPSYGRVHSRQDFAMSHPVRATTERVQAPDITIGPAARVTAQIHAQTIRIAGAIIGDLHAAETVRILASARVLGDVQARTNPDLIAARCCSVSVANCPPGHSSARSSESQLRVRVQSAGAASPAARPAATGTTRAHRPPNVAASACANRP